MERPSQLNKDELGNYECYGCGHNMVKGVSTYGFEFLKCPDRCRDNRHNWTLEGAIFKEEFIAQSKAEFFDARRAKYGGYLSYYEYIVSPEWRTRSIAVCTSRGSKCEVCGSKEKIQVHHRSYERMGQETEEDLEVVCKSCHELIHWAANQYPEQYAIDTASALLRASREDLAAEKQRQEINRFRLPSGRKPSKMQECLPATTSQIYTLRKLGYKGVDDISKGEAWTMIQSLMGASK
jgi:hypothetical protein